MRCLRYLVLFLVVSLWLPAGPASAATIVLTTTNAFKPIILEAIPIFEARTGHKVDLQNALTSIVIKRATVDNVPFDVVVISGTSGPEAPFKPFLDKGLIVPGSIRGMAKGSIGMAIKAGAPRPKIDTPEQFAEALLKADKIAYSDPSTGGLSGLHMAAVFKRLGIEEKIRAKLMPLQARQVPESVVKGDADVALQQTAELMIPGLDLVGMLPEEIQLYTHLCGAISANTKYPEAAKELLDIFVSKEMKALLTSKGLKDY